MSKKQIDDMQKRVNGNNFHCPEYMNLLQGLFQVKNIDILDRKKNILCTIFNSLHFYFKNYHI